MPSVLLRGDKLTLQCNANKQNQTNNVGSDWESVEGNNAALYLNQEAPDCNMFGKLGISNKFDKMNGSYKTHSSIYVAVYRPF